MEIFSIFSVIFLPLFYGFGVRAGVINLDSKFNKFEIELKNELGRGEIIR